MIKERPILFSTPMVRALLDGTKTQTRRICTTRSQAQTDIMGYALMADIMDKDEGVCEKAAWEQLGCPYGTPGDRLWVRETWAPAAVLHRKAFICFRADGDNPNAETSTEVLLESDDALLKAHRDLAKGHWIPGIHMHRWASRITLEIESIHVERLQDISEEDARAEGIRQCRVGDVTAFGVDPEDRDTLYPTARYAFNCLWESINGPGSWESNPWVWVVIFKRAEGGAK